MVREFLDEILSNKCYDKLEPYRDPATWERLSLEERDMLGDLFAIQGEKLLQDGKTKGFEYYELATDVTVDNCNLFFEKGIAYATHSSTIKGLKSACKAFRHSTKLNKSYFEAWHAWAKTLVDIGVVSNKGEYFFKAHKKFLEAQSKTPDDLSDELRGQFYWHWGQCWYYAGKDSGETIDFRKALEHYEYAANSQVNTALFWNDYGNALVELSFLLGDQRGYLKALEVYQRAVKEAPEFFEGWFNLACGFQYLFITTMNPEYYCEAETSFECASQANSEHSLFWLKWGQLCVSAGKLLGEDKLLFTSLDKFKEANRLERDHPQVLRCWGEALMLCGVQTEQLALIKLAEERIAKSLDLDDQDEYCWYIYGCCYNELGRYFEDTSYYFAAVKHFQKGIDLKQSDPTLWYGLSLALLSLGELTQDPQFLEEASKCCMRVIECGNGGSPQFWNDWGVILFKISELTGQEKPLLSALRMFEEALSDKAENKSEELFLNYGKALIYLADLRDEPASSEKAVKALRFALSLNPNHLHVHYQLAFACSQLGEFLGDLNFFVEAQEHFNYVVSQDPEDDTALHDWGITLMHLGMHLFDSMRHSEAKVALDQAEKRLIQALSLGNNLANYNLACLYSLFENSTAALHYLERAEQMGVLPSIDELLSDEWLENFRKTEAFQKLLSRLPKSNYPKQ